MNDKINNTEVSEHKNGAHFGETTANEFASDFIVETPNTSTRDSFTEIPDEYAVEQSATTDNAYGDTHDVTDMYVTQTRDGYATQTNEQTAISDTEVTGVDKIGYDVTESHDPSDETAATIDEWYTTDKPTSARERCMLDDYEIISDVLGSEKQLVKLYSTALCEASEEPFRNVLRENLDNAAENQYKAFEYMQKRGMYPTEQASEENISKAKQQFGSLTDCNCGCKSNPCGCNSDGCNVNND